MKALRGEEIRGSWAALLLPIGESDAIDYERLAAEITGAPRNRLYDAALAIKQAAEEDPIED